MKSASKRALTSTIGLVFALALAPAAFAESPPVVWKSGDLTIKPFLSDRLRVEVVDWFDPGPGGANEDYSFVANVIRFGTDLQWRDWKVTIEGQEAQLFSVPSDSAGLGPGAVYYASTAQKNQREIAVRRAVLQWDNAFTKGLGVAGGRYILNDGLETLPEDKGLSWLKKNRISQRLIGGFDYTHIGRSFDGGFLHYDMAPWNLTIAGGRPSAGGFNVSSNNEVEDVGVVYAALTVTEPGWLTRADGRVFYLFYEDDRNLVATDNRSLAARQADFRDISIHTVGANFENLQRIGPGDLDLLAWVAGQTGDWESLDHSAWALALEAGYHLVDVPTKPWFRAGWFRGSGDDNPNDGQHGTFFQALPTARLYAQTPFFNLMNNQDLFLQVILSPMENMGLRVDWHHLWVTEDQDLLYAGGGATQSTPLFGYAGFSAQGRSEVADLLDFSLDYTFNRNVKCSAYYGHGFGGSVIDAQFAGSSQLDYAFFEFTLSL